MCVHKPECQAGPLAPRWANCTLPDRMEVEKGLAEPQPDPGGRTLRTPTLPPSPLATFANLPATHLPRQDTFPAGP